MKIHQDAQKDGRTTESLCELYQERVSLLWAKDAQDRLLQENWRENAQGTVGLSMYHKRRKILPDAAMRSRANTPRVTLWRGASLIIAELGDLQKTPGKAHEWIRGKITQFSKQSRRRILRTVAKLKREKMSSFVTLTYPDQFEEDPRKVKKQWANFSKRLIYNFPEIVVIWRMEPMERKSGSNAGKIAPHFHLLIWGADYKTLLAWIPKNWFEVVGSNDEKHLMAGTRVERVRSTHGVMYYTAKYICKAENYVLDGWGRYWGIVNRELLQTIQGERAVIEVSDQDAKTLLRYMRRRASEVYRKGKFVGRRKFPKWGHKFTLVGSADFWESSIIKMRQ